MTDRRGSRFVVEVLFLVALAAALALARLDALEIAGGMLLGWLVVVAFEWAAWRGEPHFASGLPPRYYIPPLGLPPAQPLEQVEAGYPDASRDEAPTWIAPAELRAEVLGEWPHASPLVLETEPVEAEAGEDAAEDDEEQQEFAAAADEGADPWTVQALPAVAGDEDDEPEAAAAEPELEPEPADSPAAEPALRPVPAGRLARYRFDPLAEAAPRRRFRRQHAEELDDAVEVAARPHGPRRLPGRAGSG